MVPGPEIEDLRGRRTLHEGTPFDRDNGRSSGVAGGRFGSVATSATSSSSAVPAGTSALRASEFGATVAAAKRSRTGGTCVDGGACRRRCWRRRRGRCAQCTSPARTESGVRAGDRHACRSPGAAPGQTGRSVPWADAARTASDRHMSLLAAHGRVRVGRRAGSHTRCGVRSGSLSRPAARVAGDAVRRGQVQAERRTNARTISSSATPRT